MSAIIGDSRAALPQFEPEMAPSDGVPPGRVVPLDGNPASSVDNLVSQQSLLKALGDKGLPDGFVPESVVDAVLQQLDASFVAGEGASFDDLLDRLKAIKADLSLSEDGRLAFDAFVEEVVAHLEEMRGLMRVYGLVEGGCERSGTVFAKHAEAVLALVRRAAKDPRVDVEQALEKECLELMSLIANGSTFLLIFDAAVRLRLSSLKSRLVFLRARRRPKPVKPAAAMSRPEDCGNEIRELFRRYEQMMERLLEQINRRLETTPLLFTAASQRLEEQRRDMIRIVSGFEARLERLRQESRDEHEETLERLVEERFNDHPCQI